MRVGIKNRICFIFLFIIKNLNSKTNKFLILSVFLFGCETWSLTQNGEHRLGVIENRVLREIFGPKWEEVRGDWRKLHNEEHVAQSSPSCYMEMQGVRE